MSSNGFLTLEKLRNLWATASAVLLLGIAILGVVYDAVHRFGPEAWVRKVGSPEEVLILLVALLCGGLGAERLLTLKKIESDIELAQEQRATLMKDVAKILPATELLELAQKQRATLREDVGKILHATELLSAKVKRLRTEIVIDMKGLDQKEEDLLSEVRRINKTETLIGPREIEKAALGLIDDCNDNAKIKATGQYRVGDGLSQGYFKHLAERVSRAQGQGMEYYVVIPAGQSGGPQQEDERVQAFETAKVRDKLRMRGAKQPMPFEVLMSEDSMIIALLGGDAKSKYELAVRITDPVFVKKASDWYREVLWEGADKV